MTAVGISNGVHNLALNGNHAIQEPLVRRGTNGDSDGGNGHSNGVQKGHKGVGASIPRGDEYDVDFSDTRKFVVKRWEDIVHSATSRLSPQDQKAASDYIYWQDVKDEIQAKLSDSSSTQNMKRQMSRIHAFPSVLVKLTMTFDGLIVPFDVKFDVLWGLIYLNLKMSYTSLDRLKRTCDLMDRLRKVTVLFNRCLETCDEKNEARIAVIDYLDPIVMVLVDCIDYFHEHLSEKESAETWPDMRANIDQQLASLDYTVKHVSEISNFSKVNRDRQVKSLSSRHAALPDSEEPGVFPNRILPFQRNRTFYGRKEELDKILKYLKPKDQDDGVATFRTYTIYGRRGVGKTEIALQFAHVNPGGYDAIFWIQCETSVSIRQSFTDVALSLNLPGAAKDGHHEENLLAVLKWLKLTKKKWLLIFDNAERDQILQKYWPVGAMGAILITSREYYNFAKDESRKGDTVKPFTDDQSWELLLKLLGEDWEKADRENTIPQSEIVAAKKFLSQLEGLALAVRQAAVMIKDPNIGGPTIAKTYEKFKERMRTLPPRHSSRRSASEIALDSLWDMTFSALGAHARTLLSVFSWLSPDSIPVDLFLPRNQSVLDGSLSFCKQVQNLNPQKRTSIISALAPSPEFTAAVDELLKRELIKRDNRIYSIHRVVQEAVNYHDEEDLQNSFNIATSLVHEAFPKVIMNQPLIKYWTTCQVYIPHGVFLSRKFAGHVKSGSTGKLKSSPEFVQLLHHCGWYLFEVADYDVCNRVVETATAACDNKKSLLYADIRNTAGGRFYDLNELARCRRAWEDTLKIRKELLDHDHPQMAAIYNNFGNLELSTGNPKWAKENFDRAMQIWVAGGDSTAIQLALTHLCVGRLHTLKRNIDEAWRETNLAETLFLRTMGADKGFMANVHYVYGNIHMLQKDWDQAWRSFDECLKIGLATMPLHPITAAAYYSLGCVKFEQGDLEPSKAWLEKARSIAQLNSPVADDGPTARILWKLAQVLEADPEKRFTEEALDLRNRAAIARAKLLATGKGGAMAFLREDDAEDADDEEEDYDVLVPLFYR
ncbi:hypothetical protein IFR05_002958 [Cadophora sp. M221]|nr:hypothetical protein IFR05_002958 [Cadophora sp. M221]